MTQPPITREQAAQLKVQREMSKHTNSSIYGRDGKLDTNRANELSEGYVGLGEYLDLGKISYPPDPDGSEHSRFLARIVEYMAQIPEKGPYVSGGIVGGPLNHHDRKVLHAVSMLYSVGKKEGLEGYSERSAAHAEKFFREGGGAGTYWSKESVREDTCRLIYHHTRPEAIREDKRLQIFADGCRYEMCRFGVNTGPGIAMLRENWKAELFYSGWAADTGNRRQYMVDRGWR